MKLPSLTFDEPNTREKPLFFTNLSYFSSQNPPTIHSSSQAH
ncbi:hypothetical protein [Moraxella lacunata]